MWFACVHIAPHSPPQPLKLAVTGRYDTSRDYFPTRHRGDKRSLSSRPAKGPIVVTTMDLDITSPGTPSSPHPHPPKRPRPSSPPNIKHSPTSGSTGPISPSAEHSHEGGAKSAQGSSSFRNVSACNRCRLRKNRCDQKLPSCASCEKARVACVGYDPITKREIPRRLVRVG